jgi:hypothetical protein
MNMPGIILKPFDLLFVLNVPNPHDITYRSHKWEPSDISAASFPIDSDPGNYLQTI